MEEGGCGWADIVCSRWKTQVFEDKPPRSSVKAAIAAMEGGGCGRANIIRN
jgi:hypothetical protein